MTFAGENPLFLALFLVLLVLCVASLVMVLMLSSGSRSGAAPGGFRARPHPRAWLGEGIGTLALVFVGILTAARGDTALAEALAVGMTVAALVASVGAVSGGHYHPAVTLGCVLTRRLSLRDGLGYVAAQMAGAVLAGALATAVLGPGPVAAARPTASGEIAPAGAFGLEAVASFVLVLAVLQTLSDDRVHSARQAAVAGLLMAAAVLALDPFTGAALNPVRFVGPALAAWQGEGTLVGVAGPLAGGCLAAAVHRLGFGRKAAAPSQPVLSRPSRLPRREEAAA
jgi:glycerol uptake facilitator-like aquaporin